MANLWTELKRRNVIRVALVYAFASWLLIQVADIMFESFGTPDWVMKTFIGFLGLGFPIAVIVAWAFEMTPEGLKKEKDVDRSKSITPQTGRRIDFVIIGLMAVGIIYLVADNYILDGGSADVADAKMPSIAVLPFVNMSADPEQEFFSDGISEELLNLLAKVPDFQVAGRTSSFLFKGNEEDLRVIAEKLGVDNILEGSVRKQGDRVRITAQLVKAEDGFHLWSETYDRQLDDIFAIQDEIATAVVTALKETLLGETVEPVAIASTAAGSTEAYELYLKGRYQWHKRTPEALALAIELFKEAIQLDPSYAPAYAGLSDAYQLSIDYSDLDPQTATAKAEEMINRAFELDPNLADAWASRGLLENNQNDMEAAVSSLLRAIELNPNHAMAHMWLAGTYRALGDNLNDLETLEKAHRIDPLHPTIMGNLCFQLTSFNRLDDADAVAHEMVQMHPGNGVGYSLKGWVAYRRGPVGESVRWYRRAHEIDPQRIVGYRSLVFNYLDLGADDLAEAWLNEVRRVAPNDFATIFGQGAILEARGDFDALVAHAQAIFERFGVGVWRIYVADGLMRTGDYEQAREHFERGLRRGETITTTRENVNDIVRYAAALQKTGDETLALRFLDEAFGIYEGLQSEGFVGAFGNLEMQTARIYALRGDNVDALAALRRNVAHGDRGTSRWKTDYRLASLHDNVGFLNLIAEVEAELAEQRAALETEGLMSGPPTI